MQLLWFLSGKRQEIHDDELLLAKNKRPARGSAWLNYTPHHCPHCLQTQASKTIHRIVVYFQTPQKTLYCTLVVDDDDEPRAMIEG